MIREKQTEFFKPMLLDQFEEELTELKNYIQK